MLFVYIFFWLEIVKEKAMEIVKEKARWDLALSIWALRLIGSNIQKLFVSVFYKKAFANSIIKGLYKRLLCCSWSIYFYTKEKMFSLSFSSKQKLVSAYMFVCDWAKLLNYIIDTNLFDKRHSSREFKNSCFSVDIEVELSSPFQHETKLMYQD